MMIITLWLLVIRNYNSITIYRNAIDIIGYERIFRGIGVDIIWYGDMFLIKRTGKVLKHSPGPNHNSSP